jgi:hypothetical protein
MKNTYFLDPELVEARLLPITQHSLRQAIGWDSEKSLGGALAVEDAKIQEHQPNLYRIAEAVAFDLRTLCLRDGSEPPERSAYYPTGHANELVRPFDLYTKIGLALGSIARRYAVDYDKNADEASQYPDVMPEVADLFEASEPEDAVLMLTGLQAVTEGKMRFSKEIFNTKILMNFPTEKLEKAARIGLLVGYSLVCIESMNPADDPEKEKAWAFYLKWKKRQERRRLNRDADLMELTPGYVRSIHAERQYWPSPLELPQS